MDSTTLKTFSRQLTSVGQRKKGHRRIKSQKGSTTKSVLYRIEIEIEN